MFKRFPLFFLCAALFSGCATHPKHTPAAVETAETLGLPASSQPPIAPQWWRALNDAKLDGLIDTALARSPDLAAAQARLRQAQAGADLADSQRGVKIGLGLSGALLHRDGVNEREKPELISDLEKRLLGDHGTNITYESLQLQGQWSPDVFGKYKHQLEAALGQQRAVEYEIAQTRLLLAQGVATYYRQWQLLLETRQRVAQRAQLNREREQVVRELIRAGQVAPSRLYAVQQGNSRFQAALSDLDGNIAQIRHALAALTGQPAQALDNFAPNPAATTPAARVAAHRRFARQTPRFGGAARGTDRPPPSGCQRENRVLSEHYHQGAGGLVQCGNRQPAAFVVVSRRTAAEREPADFYFRRVAGEPVAQGSRV